MSSNTTRRTRNETAELVREAAVQLLQRDGLQGFANSVRLDDALTLLEDQRGVRLTHGSIYGRIWDDQRDFQLDVVATTVARYDGTEIGTAIVEASGPDTTVTGLFAAAVAVARQSRMWNLWLGAHNAVVSTPGTDDDERLASALAAAEERVVTTLTDALTVAVGPEAAGSARLLLTLLIGASVTTDTSAAERLLTLAVT